MTRLRVSRCTNAVLFLLGIVSFGFTSAARADLVLASPPDAPRDQAAAPQFATDLSLQAAAAVEPQINGESFQFIASDVDGSAVDIAAMPEIDYAVDIRALISGRAQQPFSFGRTWMVPATRDAAAPVVRFRSEPWSPVAKFSRDQWQQLQFNLVPKSIMLPGVRHGKYGYVRSSGSAVDPDRVDPSRSFAKLAGEAQAPLDSISPNIVPIANARLMEGATIAVPEPGTISLLVCACTAMLSRRRTRRH